MFFYSTPIIGLAIYHFTKNGNNTQNVNTCKKDCLECCHNKNCCEKCKKENCCSNETCKDECCCCKEGSDDCKCCCSEK